MSLENQQQCSDKKTTPCSFGGQAVIEGVMMRGSNSMALAVRADNGEILIDTKHIKPITNKFLRLPFVRGVTSLFVSMFIGIKTMMKSAEVFSTEDEELSKGGIIFAVVLGIGLSLGLFIFLPTLIASLFGKLWGLDSALWQGIIEGVSRLIIFIGYLLLTSLIKDIRRTYMYHGAEHKVINTFEAGEELSVENVLKHSKKHNRCGTTFLFFVVFVSIVLFALTNYLTGLMGIPSTWYYKILTRFVLIPFVAGISFELLKLMAKLPDNRFTAIIRWPGLSLQAITTKEPDEKIAEVAIASFKACHALELDKELKTSDISSVDLKDTLEKLKEILSKVNAEECEADWIVCDILSCKRTDLASKEKIKRTEHNKAIAYANKRVKENLPLAYVLGNAAFYGYKVKVNRNVLIPRPETELLAEQVINIVKNTTDLTNKTIRVLDLCTGSGCIALAISKKNKKALKQGTLEIVASDISPEALEVASFNLQNTGVKVVKSDLLNSVEGEFDIIVSNPPYIAERELESLQTEVKKEPLIALLAGEEGLDIYRRIASDVKNYLKPKGILLLEVGQGQADNVIELLDKSFDCQKLNDYSGIERIVKAELK